MLVTKYLGPTNTRGARIRVSTVSTWLAKKTLTVSWNNELSERDNHDRAVRMAVDKFYLLDKLQVQYMARVYICGGYAYGWYNSNSDSLLLVGSD
jgi:hypothetical protein